MATGTGNLPNPSMAFTPFDILLAEELNDLVENIEALATGSGIGDGAIGTSDLANGAVTSQKVDFTTFTHVVARKSSTQSLASASLAAVIYQTESVDRLGEYNPTTGIFIPQESGVYTIVANMRFTSTFTAAINNMSIYDVTGASTICDISNPNYYNYTILTISASLNLIAGRSYAIYAYQNSGSARTIDNNSASQFLTIVRTA